MPQKYTRLTIVVSSLQILRNCVLWYPSRLCGSGVLGGRTLGQSSQSLDIWSLSEQRYFLQGRCYSYPYHLAIGSSAAKDFEINLSSNSELRLGPTVLACRARSLFLKGRYKLQVLYYAYEMSIADQCFPPVIWSSSRCKFEPSIYLPLLPRYYVRTLRFMYSLKYETPFYCITHKPWRGIFGNTPTSRKQIAPSLAASTAKKALLIHHPTNTWIFSNKALGSILSQPVSRW